MKNKAELLESFEIFRGNGGGIENWLSNSLPDSVAEILLKCEEKPISVEVLNQLLILSHEGCNQATYSFAKHSGITITNSLLTGEANALIH